MPNYASQTNFEKIFSLSYWGTFPLIILNGTKFIIEKEIIDNRNSFATEYKLKKSLCYTSKGHNAIKDIFKNTLYEIERQGNYIDHIEYYDTGYSVVCVTSHHCSNEQELIFNKYGFRKINPIYCPEQKTFMMELFYGRKNE
jgi:hypothetical protein